MISYVVTLYNKARYLPQVVAALAQQQGDFAREFIFVDDGSADDTLALLRGLTTDLPNTTILTQPNQGPAVALNTGLGAAKGSLIKPMDGDDVLLPWATTWLLEALAATGAHAACSVPEDQWEYPVGATIPPWPTPPLPAAQPQDLLPQSLRRAQTMPSVWLLRREALEACGGCDLAVFIQDYSLELRLAALGPVAMLHAPLVAFPAEAPGRLSDNQAQTLHDVNLAALRFLAANPALPPRLRQLVLKRATARAYAWAVRRGAPLLAPGLLLRRLCANAGVLPGFAGNQVALTAPFRATHPIRPGAGG